MKRFWERLSKREKSLIGLSLLIFLAVSGHSFLFTPYSERRVWVKSQLELQMQQLEKNLRFIGQQTEIDSSLEKARVELKGLEPTLLSGDTPSLSASDLQQTVQGLASKEGVQVITTRVLNPDSDGSFTKILVQVEIAGKIEQVVNLIKQIESTDKFLIVNELNIRSLVRPVVVARQRAVTTVPEQNLRVSLTVAGFVRNSPNTTGTKEDLSAVNRFPGRTAPRR